MIEEIKALLPHPVRQRLGRAHLALMRICNGMRSTEDVFNEIYAKNEWGGGPGEISSGSGSRGKAAEVYIQTINAFVTQHGIKSIVDIGCGDFYIARQILDLAGPGISYSGLDVARIVVETNNQKFARNGVAFHWANAVTDELPAADLCLVRQVFQHLSNKQISAILPKLLRYKWAIITEHYPSPADFKAFNLDKPQGSDTRLFDGSAVYLDRPPFNLRNISLLAHVDLDAADCIRTWLVPTKVSASTST